MDTDFNLQVKCTIFWLNIGLRVYLLEAFLLIKTTKNMSKPTLAKKERGKLEKCVELKCGACYLKKKISAHRLGLGSNWAEE